MAEKFEHCSIDIILELVFHYLIVPAYIFQTLVPTLYKISLCSQVSYYLYRVVYKQKTPSLYVAQYDSFFLLWPFKAILFSWFCPFLSQFVVVDGSKAMHSVDEIYCVLYDLYICTLWWSGGCHLWLPWITTFTLDMPIF